MTLLTALILTAAATATPLAPPPEQANRWHRFVVAAHAMEVPTERLDAALRTAPRRATMAATRYCFDDRLTDPVTPRRLCRTRADWQAFGLDPADD